MALSDAAALTKRSANKSSAKDENEQRNDCSVVYKITAVKIARNSQKRRFHQKFSFKKRNAEELFYNISKYFTTVGNNSSACFSFEPFKVKVWEELSIEFELVRFRFEIKF